MFTERPPSVTIVVNIPRPYTLDVTVNICLASIHALCSGEDLIECLGRINDNINTPMKSKSRLHYLLYNNYVPNVPTHFRDNCIMFFLANRLTNNNNINTNIFFNAVRRRYKTLNLS